MDRRILVAFMFPLRRVVRFYPVRVTQHSLGSPQSGAPQVARAEKPNPNAVQQSVWGDVARDVEPHWGQLQMTPSDILWLLHDHQNTVTDVATMASSGNSTATLVNHLGYKAFRTIASQTNSA